MVVHIFLLFTLCYLASGENFVKASHLSSDSIEAAACGDQTSCSSCTNTKQIFNISCRWCGRDNKCYNYASLSNPCSRYENINDNKYCVCAPGCKQPVGIPNSACEWYIQGNINSPPADPAQWSGGHFLPLNYKSAARCACSGKTTSGQQNPLWLKPSPNCIRMILLKQHQALPNDIKRAIRNATLAGYNLTSLTSTVQLIYKMHQISYQQCCCTGSIAPFAAWVSIMIVGNALPCAGPVSIQESILDFGRCGCGW